MSNDPFARYALNGPNGARALDPVNDSAAIGFFGADPESAYRTATNPLANNMNLFGAGRQFMQDAFQKVYQRYQADEGLNIANNKPATGSFYDYARNFNYGDLYNQQTPQQRGNDRPFFPGARFVRSF